MFRHFRYFSSLSFMLVKHPSESRAEALVKARPYHRTNRVILASNALTAGAGLAGVVRFCLRASKPWRKIAAVALYLALIRDVIYFGSNAGLLLTLSHTMNQLLAAPPETRVHLTVARIAQIVAEGKPLPDLHLVANYLNGQDAAAESGHAGFVQNTFFAENPQLVPRVAASPSFFYAYNEASPAWAELLGSADCLLTRRLARRALSLTHALWR